MFYGSSKVIVIALRLVGMSWGVKLTPVWRPKRVSLGGSGVSIGGVGSLRVGQMLLFSV